MKDFNTEKRREFILNEQIDLMLDNCIIPQMLLETIKGDKNK